MTPTKPMAFKHYEWIIAVCAFLFIFANIGIPSTSFSVFQPYIVDIIGDTGGSIVLFTRSFSCLLAMFVVDRYLRRFDIRFGVAIATLTTAAGFLIYSFATTLPVFAAGAFIAGIGYGFGGMVAMTMLLGRWFKDNVSTAVGFAAVGSGVASVLMPLLSLRLITYHSLSTAFLAESIIAASIAVILFLFLRNNPSDIGAQPYTAPPKTGGAVEKTARHKHGPGIYPSKPMRYALLVGMVLLGGVASAGTAYLTVLMTSEGFDPVFAGFLFAAMGAALTIAKFVAGRLFDRIGTNRGSEILFGILIISLIFSCFMPVKSPFIAAATALAFGIGISLATTGISVWSLELTDPPHMAQTIKRFQIAYAAGGTFFNIVPGMLKEAAGNYVVSYAIMLVFAITTGWIVRAAYKSVGRA